MVVRTGLEYIYMYTFSMDAKEVVRYLYEVLLAALQLFRV